MSRKGRKSRDEALEDGSFNLERLREILSETPASSDAYEKEVHRHFLSFIEELPCLTPRQIYDQIGLHSYEGQEKPRRTLSLMAYRHVQRLRHLYLAQTPPEELPPKSNHLLIGPTGCGKTYLVEILFRHLLKIPTVLLDITTYSETGYVGQDVASIMTRLLYAADGAVPLAEIGVICLDEFDKIASSQNNAVFAGAGTTKDVSGLGVQRELLKLLESTVVTVPTEFSHNSYQQQILMSTANIPFIACGAFSGFKMVSQLDDREPRMGFTRRVRSRPPQDIAVSYSLEEVEQTRYFHRYGFLPELIARFDRIVPFQALDEATLGLILRKNVLFAYQKEFRLAGIELCVTDAVIDHIVRQALKREIGARGLRSAMAQLLEDAAFEIYSDGGVKKVIADWHNEQLHIHRE